MKTMLLITCVGMLLLSLKTKAQVRITITDGDELLKMEPIDRLVFTVQYETFAVADTTRRENPSAEMMMLKVGAKASVYYSYSKYLADSVVAAGRAAGLSMETLVEQLKSYQSQIDYKIYKNFPTGKTTTLDQVALGRFRCEEKNEIPDWEVLPDTLSVLGYACQKAVCTFKGRQYTAWFTTEIPRSEGPWKLQGLPGLILQAADSRDEYTFRCVALTQSHEEESILFGATGYETVSRRDLNRVYERYAADPIGYTIASAPNVKIDMRGPDGQPIRPMNTPFNPIEKVKE